MSQPKRPPRPPFQVMQRETSYIEALKAHQKQRLDLMREETAKLYNYMQLMRKEVERLENEIIRKQGSAGGAQVNWAEKSSQIRHENRSLRIDCHCLTMEVDLQASGQAPLGVTDENFYKNIPSGPNGHIIRQHRVPPPYLPPLAPRGDNNNLLQLVPPAPSQVWLSPPPHVSQSAPVVAPWQSPHSPRPNFQNHPPAFNQPLVVETSRPPQASGGNSQQSDEAELWGCSKCTFKNHPDLKTCEVCETSRHNFVSVENVNQDSDEGARWTCLKCTFENHPDLKLCEVCETSRNNPLEAAANCNEYGDTVPLLPANISSTSVCQNCTDCYCHNYLKD